ncbi:hypothetical protein SAMN05216466_10665 [Paraburkholderia phenazinium]|uniref:Uncharacterized protein n=1 Tax=Paraburkholderia phenazinium TaxID=60549 RepID=A0A1G7Y7D7_9BURK|nr:hypothetical protein [Paraburkholderia phenazinium]SDG92277.1 hypothetical protein SAMN05216466_10665 [Paraburkholderia phenazinium]
MLNTIELGGWLALLVILTLIVPFAAGVFAYAKVPDPDTAWVTLPGVVAMVSWAGFTMGLTCMTALTYFVLLLAVLVSNSMIKFGYVIEPVQASEAWHAEVESNTKDLDRVQVPFFLAWLVVEIGLVLFHVIGWHGFLIGLLFAYPASATIQMLLPYGMAIANIAQGKD